MRFPDLIFISLENWDDIWRRNQFVCSTLARRHPSSRILFVGLPRNISHEVRHGRLGAAARDLLGLKGSSLRPVRDFPNIALLNPLKLLPDSWNFSLELNQAMFRAYIRKAAKRLGMYRPIVWVNAHQAGHVAGEMDESALIYDVTDDWTSFDQPPWLRQRTIEQDEMLCRRADAVIVCSKRLYDMKSDLVSGDLHLIANGVNAGHYDAVMDGVGDLPPAARSWPRPVFGYTGTIHPDRVDIELVHQIADQMQSGSLVFIGPNHLSEIESRMLSQTGRVILHGPAPYDVLPQLMRGFDACIVPHRTTEFVESLQPIKLWEYLAAGKPIVSTDVAGFRDFPQFVRIAADAGDFASGMREALSEQPDLSAQRRAEARRHSWASRVDQVEAVLLHAQGVRQASGLSAPPPDDTDFENHLIVRRV